MVAVAGPSFPVVFPSVSRVSFLYRYIDNVLSLGNTDFGTPLTSHFPLASLAHRSNFATAQLSRNYTEMDKSDKAIKSPSSSQRATSETQSNRSLEKLVAKDRLSCSTQRGNSALGQRHHTQKTVKHTKPSVRGRAHQRQCGKPFLSAICVEGIRFTMHLSF